MVSYNIKVKDDEETKFIISKDFSKAFNLSKVKSSFIRFGFKIIESTIIIDDNLPSNEIVISQNIIEQLKLPTYCNFNITVNKQGEIIFGPFIGIYMGRKETTLIKKLRIIDSYVKKYKEVNGAVFAFTLDNINKENFTMRGYIYNPRMDIWQKVTVPYPASIFNKTTMNTDWREYFGALYGNKIFNYNSFDKWEMYERLKQFDDIEGLFPPTKLYENVEGITEYLDQYKNLFIKPIAGKKGLGIYNVIKTNNVIQVKTRLKGENLAWEFADRNEFLTFIVGKLETNQYIIQKTLDIQIDSKAIDFRVGMDKDQTGNWNNIMFISRVSGDNSIVSNRALGGGVIRLIPDVLKDIYKMSNEEVEEYESNLVTIATKISVYLEKTGLYLGKLAFDIAIDSNKKIWIVEINSRYPDDSLANSLGDTQTYYDIRHTNMMFSKRLSGFDQTTNDTLLHFSGSSAQVNNREIKKVKIYIGVTKNNKEKFKEYLSGLLQKTVFSPDVNYNETKRKFEIVLEGKFVDINQFIQSLKISKENTIENVIGIVDLN